MSDQLIRGLMVVGLIAAIAPSAMAQTTDTPAPPPATEAPVPTPPTPPATEATPAPPAAPAATTPPAPPAATTGQSTAPAAAPSPASQPAATAEPEPVAPGLSLPEVTVQQRQPVKQIAGPPVGETEIQVAPGRLSEVPRARQPRRPKGQGPAEGRAVARASPFPRFPARFPSSPATRLSPTERSRFRTPCKSRCPASC